MYSYMYLILHFMQDGVCVEHSLLHGERPESDVITHLRQSTRTLNERFADVTRGLNELFTSRDAQCRNNDKPHYDTMRESLWSTMRRFSDVCRARSAVMTSLLFRFLQ